MDWILFVFSRGFRHYLVPSESEESAWIKLSKRQSMSLRNCKSSYTLKGYLNGNSGICKL